MLYFLKEEARIKGNFQLKKVVEDSLLIKNMKLLGAELRTPRISCSFPTAMHNRSRHSSFGGSVERILYVYFARWSPS